MTGDGDRDDTVTHEGVLVGRGDPEDPPGWVDGLPTSGRDQSCAICQSPTVAWVHRLDPDDARFRLWGKGHTLPSFWTLCSSCENLHSVGDHTTLAATMRTSPGRHDPAAEDDEHIQAPLGAFLRADRGRAALTC
jgi:hypothetical protein